MSNNKVLFDPKTPKPKLILPSQQKKDNHSKESNLKKDYSDIQKWEKRSVKETALEPQMRVDVARKYSGIIATDFKLAIKYDLEARQWKYTLYNILSSNRTEFPSMSRELLQQWTQFMDQIYLVYKEQLDLLKDMKNLKPIAWISCILHLGDLASYSIAKAHYLEASTISPGNGLVWNQLGIVSRSMGLYLASIKYYMTALCVPKHPFASARDAILELFHYASNEIMENHVQDHEMSILLESDTPNPTTLFILEKSFLALQASIYTKIGLDSLSKGLDGLVTELQNTDFSSMDSKNCCEWWYAIGLICISSYHLISTNPNFDEIGKSAALNAQLLLVEALLSSASAAIVESLPNLEGHVTFLNLILYWACSVDLSTTFIKKLSQLHLVYKTLIPQGFQEPQEMNLEDVLSKTVTSDDMVHVTILSLPSIAFECVESIDKTTMILRKKARAILLILYLSRKYPQLFVMNPQDARVVSFDDIQDDVVDDNHALGNDLDLEERLEDDTHVSTTGQNLVDSLVGAIDDNLDALNLQEKMKVLNKTFSKGSLVNGDTVIVFDTNCFLRDFETIRKIIDSTKWSIVIPLVVVTELHGLMNNESFQKVALECITYLESNINTKFRVQTSRGKTLQSLAFTSEEWDAKFTSADDVILDCCRFYSPNVCLVTNDTNLRLKARTVHVAIVDNAKKLLQLIY